MDRVYILIGLLVGQIGQRADQFFILRLVRLCFGRESNAAGIKTRSGQIQMFFQQCGGIVCHITVDQIVDDLIPEDRLLALHLHLDFRIIDQQAVDHGLDLGQNIFGVLRAGIGNAVAVFIRDRHQRRFCLAGQHGSKRHHNAPNQAQQQEIDQQSAAREKSGSRRPVGYAKDLVVRSRKIGIGVGCRSDTGAIAEQQFASAIQSNTAVQAAADHFKPTPQTVFRYHKAQQSMVSALDAVNLQRLYNDQAVRQKQIVVGGLAHIDHCG